MLLHALLQLRLANITVLCAKLPRKFISGTQLFSSMSATEKYPLHEALQGVSWLLGTWIGQGDGKYPNIKPFGYKEEITFSHIGQPNLQYQSSSWHPTTNTPLHFESGFWFFNQNCVSASIAHNLGICDIMEGEVNGKELTVTTKDITRKLNSKPPKVLKVRKTIKLLDNGDLECVMFMETEEHPLQEHLRSIFKKQ